MSRLKEVQDSQDSLNSIDCVSAEYVTSWHLSDISITLAMLYDVIAGDIKKDIYIDNNGIRIVPCSETRYETDE